MNERESGNRQGQGGGRGQTTQHLLGHGQDFTLSSVDCRWVVLSQGVTKTGFVFKRCLRLLHGEWMAWGAGLGTGWHRGGDVACPSRRGAQHPVESSNRTASSQGEGCAQDCGNTDKRNSLNLGGIAEAFMEAGMAVESNLQQGRVDPCPEQTGRQHSLGECTDQEPGHLRSNPSHPT